jgi:hypothetical protein
MMFSTVTLEFIGLYGAMMVLGAYALNTFGYLTSQSVWYQLMNFTGGIAFVYYTLEKTAWASLVVNVVWVVIAGFGLWRMRSTSKVGNFHSLR